MIPPMANHGRMENDMTPTNRMKLHRISSAANVAILALDKAADRSATGQDVEGEITDVRMLLEDIVEKLSEAMG